MTDSDAPWTATVSVRVPSESLAGMLERSLRPEAEREVPRARTVLRRSLPTTVELSVEARDSGAMRAALNTHLGWIQLALASARSAGVGAAAGPASR
jgi:tRNA threonylcarbamoyladenosine modification (KEOPS) complex  Pcc1 subunit